MSGAYQKVCAQCNRRFEAKRDHAECCSQECRWQHHIERQVLAAQTPVQRVTEHPLDEVRATQEESALNKRLGLLIRTAIIDALKTKGEVHADDLASLYPEGMVDRCRRLATAQFGSLARNGGKPLIRKTEWRKSTQPGRNGAGSWVWKFTKAGWDRYGTAGVRAETSPGGVEVGGTDSGELVSGIPDDPQGRGGDLVPPPCTNTEPPEPVQLPGLEESPAARHLRDAA